MEQPFRTAVSKKHNTEVSCAEKYHISPGQASPAPLYSREISRSQLINTINLVNFQDQIVFIIFKHKTYPATVSLQARPFPCQDNHLTCRWVEPADHVQLSELYQLDSLIITKGPHLLEIKPQLKGISEQHIHLLLPETCRQISERRMHFYPCDHIKVYLLQNAGLFHGELIEYCACQFRIRISADPPQTFLWIDSETPVNIVFARDRETLFSGECRILEQGRGKRTCDIILEPVKKMIRRFEPRQFRCPRHQLAPSPDAVFTHPFFDKKVSFKILDLSGSGFSVEEKENLALLLPGMVVPQCEIILSDGTCLRCSAQVLHSRIHRQGRHGNILRCGLVFLDMAVQDHIRLLSLLHQATDANSYVCSKVDMDALWDFFFETGFICPQKYVFLQANKEKIKVTYSKIYNMNPTIAAHFTYQESGRIIAHMAMVRFFESSWLIHHHASIRSSDHHRGLLVLNQMARFINESHRLHSIKMDHVFCFYRPENKFFNHVFGGAARNIGDRQICSIDLFGFFYCRVSVSQKENLTPGWTLETATKNDLRELQTFYKSTSAAMMLQCLHLQPEQMDSRAITEAYHQIGLKRDRHILALRHKKKLCALFVVNIADPGLNMSDLTHSVQIILLNDKHISRDIIQAAVESISVYFENARIPILFYPHHTAEHLGIENEKTYALWVYNTRNLDYFLRFLKRLQKFIQH